MRLLHVRSMYLSTTDASNGGLPHDGEVFPKNVLSMYDAVILLRYSNRVFRRINLLT